jgi:RNA polymerase sigma-70 factor (ECF subfamily)
MEGQAMTTNQNTELVTVIYNGEEIEVTREVADFLEECRLDERRQSEKIRRHHSDKECDEFAIGDLMFNKPQGFEDALIDRLAIERLPEALATLPEVQRRRVTAYYFEGLTYKQIAEREQVAYPAIMQSVNAAIKNLQKFFKALPFILPFECALCMKGLILFRAYLDKHRLSQAVISEHRVL